MLSGDKLRHLRILHGISVKEMAKGIGKSDRWVRKIEHFEVIPTEEVYQDWLNTCYKKQKEGGKDGAVG